MQNPYEVTTLESNDVRNQSRLFRSIAWAVFGYFSPLFVVAFLSWAYWGPATMRDNVDRIVRCHQTLSVSSIAAMLPSVACMIFFGFAGLRSNRTGGESGVPWLLLAVFTLAGCAITGVMLQVFPLPWTWSAEKSSVIRASLISIFPVTVIAYRWLSASRGTSVEGDA